MAFPGTGKIWMNGSLVDWKDAKIHVGSHIIHYGSGVFEGARCYDTLSGSACFRLDAHMRRLLDSARIYRMEPKYSAQELTDDVFDNLSEGSGQNVFVVREGVIYTPPVGNSVLWGITRDSVMTIARELGFDVREQTLPRESLYIADEVFFVGTAVEVTPIRSVDRIKVGRGRRGPVTEAIQQRFFQIVKGELPDTHGWLQFVNTPAAAASGQSKGR